MKGRSHLRVSATEFEVKQAAVTVAARDGVHLVRDWNGGSHDLTSEQGVSIAITRDGAKTRAAIEIYRMAWGRRDLETEAETLADGITDALGR
jgi:hypothetical protein